MPYTPTHPITSLNDLRRELPAPHPDQEAKIIDHVDEHCIAWIGSSHFALLATTAADGTIDISPKGDPTGFVHVLDVHTLALPDRPGNHRFDSFQNIFATGQVGLLFLVPQRNEVLRISGTAQIVKDPALCAALSINDRPASFVTLIEVKRAFFHCGKAIIRSRLWHADEFTPDPNLPTYAEALTAHAHVAGKDVAALENRLDHNDTHRLYDE